MVHSQVFRQPGEGIPNTSHWNEMGRSVDLLSPQNCSREYLVTIVEIIHAYILLNTFPDIYHKLQMYFLSLSSNVWSGVLDRTPCHFSCYPHTTPLHPESYSEADTRTVRRFGYRDQWIQHLVQRRFHFFRSYINFAI